MHRLVWAIALIGPAIGPAFAGVAPVDPPLYDAGAARWYCEGAAERVQLPIGAFKVLAGSHGDSQSRGNGGPDACAAFLDSSAYAFAVPGAGALAFRGFVGFGAGERDGDPDADARDAGGAWRCCHGAREKFRSEFVDLIFESSSDVPEPSTRAILLVGFCGVGLASCARAVGNRAGTGAPMR